MRILFVCTGNICRSPMGELLFRRYTQGTSLEISSAGTHSLIGHSIDPSSGALLKAVGIDASAFHSRQLTQSIANNSDLILCFEPEQRHNIVIIAPSALPYTFTLNDFSNMCAYCAQQGLVSGATIQERLRSVINQSMQIHPLLPPAATIPDPYRKNFAAFQTTVHAINDAIRNILRSISYNSGSVNSTVNTAPIHSLTGDVVKGDWPLPNISFEGALPPADIVVRDDSEIKADSTELITPETIIDTLPDESGPQDDAPVIVEDTSARDEAVATERKNRKRRTIIVASALTVAALLTVGGSIAWHVTSTNTKRNMPKSKSNTMPPFKMPICWLRFPPIRSPTMQLSAS